MTTLERAYLRMIPLLVAIVLLILSLLAIFMSPIATGADVVTACACVLLLRASFLSLRRAWRNRNVASEGRP